MMGRSSKFLFPLSGRKSTRSETHLPSSKDNSNPPPLSKAERLLGTTGLHNVIRSHLSPRPSHRSLNPSISELGDHDELDDDFSSPNHFGLEPLPLRLANLQDSPRSDAFGHRLNSSGSHRSKNSSHSRQVKPAPSSSTLISHYDASKLPLSVSQQTSNSAVRDRALRRNMSTVSEQSSISMTRPRTATASTTYSSQGETHRATALPDMSRLYPKPAFAHPHSLPSSRRSSRHPDSPPSTVHTAVPAMRFPGAAPQSRPSTSGGSLRKVAGTAGKSLKSRLSVDAFPATMKLFSRRQSQRIEPETQSKAKQKKSSALGSRNWFDNLLEEEVESDVESEHDLNLATPTADLFPAGLRDTPSPRPPHFLLNSREKPDTVYTIRKNASGHDITSCRSSATVRSPRSPLSRGSRKSNSRMAAADLGDTSILSTSSSDNDSGDEVDSNDGLARMRDSISVSDIDDEVHIMKAEAFHVQPARRPSEPNALERRPSIASISSNPTTADSSSVQSSTTGPAYLSVPHVSSRSRKSGHTRQPSLIPEDSDSPTSPTSTHASIRSFTAPQGDGRKLMAVTEEEEALLELMRRKRADKAALRDSHVKAAAEERSTTRSVRNLSASSSILDSFPLSRSQRSSLMHPRNTPTQSPADPTSNAIAAEPKEARPTSSRGRSKRQSNATSYYSIDSRIESPTRLKYAFTPHLSLASLDSLSSLPSPALEPPSSPSPEPMEEPMTPVTTRGSGDIAIRPIYSQRSSSLSYTMGETTMTVGEAIPQKMYDSIQRPKTTSNATPLRSPDTDKFEKPKRGNRFEPTPPSSDGEQVSANTSAEDLSAPSKRASTNSGATSECGPSCSHFSHRDSAGYNRGSVGYGAGIGTRCSVSEDVLAAWGSLGGWREQPGIMG